MTPRRVLMADFRSVATPGQILDLLRSRFPIEVVETDPDYVIFSVFGHQHLEHVDAIKIFFTGENIRPDFNVCDYAFGFDWIEFGDRYYRCPNYQLFNTFRDIRARGGSNVSREELRARKFCNFVYTNRAAHPARDAIFHALGRYRTVDSAGRHLNNVGFCPGTAYEDGWVDSKVAFARGYRFTVACENASTPGYTTEKIVDALAADTIPIYFGNPLIEREFNPARFVNCHDFGSLDDMVAYVSALDQDENRCLAILAEPFFAGGTVPSFMEDRGVLDRFELIFGQAKDAARRRSSLYWDWRYQEERRHQVASGPLVERLAEFVERVGPAAGQESQLELEDLRSRVAVWRTTNDLCTPYDF